MNPVRKTGARTRRLFGRPGRSVAPAETLAGNVDAKQRFFGRPALSAALGWALLAGAVAALPAPSPAQSLVGVRGLGVVGGTGDGRASAAGNLGIGLAGVEVSATDPTAGAELLFPTIGVTMQPTWGEFELDQERGDVHVTRFPLIGIAFPVGAARGAFTAAVSGQMDQRWAGQVPRTADVGDSVGVPVSDRFEADGGISIVRAGWVQRIGASFAAGVSAGAYLGRLDQTYDRTLDTLALGGDVRSFVQEGAWRYGGTIVSAGASAAPHRLIHLAAAVEWSSDLKATPTEGTDGDVRVYSIPLRVLAGATGRLTPRLALNASFAYQDWSTAEGFAPGVTTSAKYSFGAGLEMQLIRGARRSLPLRAGYRRLAQPFRFESDDPVETVWSAGAGLNLLETDGIRRGWLDVGVARGERSSAPLVERYWRVTASLGISQF